jgi:hypothetical protein
MQFVMSTGTISDLPGEALIVTHTIISIAAGCADPCSSYPRPLGTVDDDRLGVEEAGLVEGRPLRRWAS